MWLYINRKIESYRAGSETHESLWGFDAMKYWRGRLDKKTLEISVIAPVSYKGSGVPQYIEDALENKFGTGLTYYRFNPLGTRMQ